MKYVIIGAGAAGFNAALTIKKNDRQAEVILFGDERFFPYNRYQLTDFLCDSIQQEELFYASPESLQDTGIRFRKGQYVKSIDPGEKSIRLFHNEVVHYDRLLIATGGRPWLGSVLLPYKKHIQRYYSLKDIRVLKKKLPEIRTCIVFGEGLSSLDLLCGLHKAGKKVTYIVRRDKPEWPLVEPALCEELIRFQKEQGIVFLTEDRISAVEKEGDRFRVLTLKQRELPADIVFAWDNYKPKISCINGTGIEKRTGILVNEYLETSVEDIYAAGDCVEIYHPGIKKYWINYGWPNALEQGEIAGLNMTGQKRVYRVHETIEFNLMGKSLKARWWK